MKKQLLIEHSLFHPTLPINEVTKSRNGNMIVVGQVQASDKPNANKRVYPYDILEKQVEKYMLGPIKENRALGELDHPECLRPSAQILTSDGWKYLKEVQVGEKVMTLNTETSICEWNAVERVIDQPYKGKMISFKGRGIDTEVTPNHRFVLRDRKGNYEEATAQQILDHSAIYSYHSIPVSLEDYRDSELDSVLLSSTTIKEVDYDSTVHCVTVKNGNFYCKDQGLSFLSGNSSVINLKNVSHNIIDLWWQGKDLYGKIEVLPTPSGNILRQLFENNITVGISSRAMGSVSSIGEGIVKVEDDLDLICWDFVSTPSTYGAYMKPVGSRGLQESYDRTIKLEDKYSRANKIISEIICALSGVCCIN
jgi:hypothetical protein